MSESDVLLRPARDADGPAVSALIEPIFAEYEGVLFIPEEMPELETLATTFARAGGAFFCAERDGRVVGCVGWVPSRDDHLELKKLYVAKSERRSGLGSRLAGLVEEEARRRGLAVELWSDAKFVTAHHFYERRGYRRDGRTRELHDASDTLEYYFRRDLDCATEEGATEEGATEEPANPGAPAAGGG